MKKIALFLLILVQACSEMSDFPPQIWDTRLSISFLNKEGNDLLNPNGNYPESVNTNTIKLYHVIDGKESLVYNKHSDESRWGYSLLEPEGEYTNYRLGIAVNIYSPANITETIIQWDEDRRDVLKTEIYRSGGLTQLRNIWLNEELVWEWEKDDIDKQGFRFIEIRK